ncbi:MAG TPA: ATP-binding cassette domain-containing protein [Deltaproteobacteria bacterium]|jgi:energy-coupling factor transport system ATP-binding protein|nr:ATP-binding cassette domain-containing protein [Pseudomonadota bacterium]HOE72132.1 ATP-binding cassette domain-containing protein [Deltaproteobacteria bacterium]HOS26223.1 ATP-binding cassette domain-containing protein [Deltaproteobacteria bacterium]HPL86077.1 ATP-binding cassette domain-containing protein [Deltaproteobacteria bacterium]
MKIECADVFYRYDVPGDGWALRDISFSLEQGEKVAVIGHAGSGKTTLIQLLDALILPEKGDIRYDGQSLLALSKTKKLFSIRRRIGVLFQFPEQQFFHETAYEELTFALRNFFDLSAEEIERRARDAAERFQLDVDMLAQISPFHLSSGEKRKLALASAIISSPEVLIFDEPTAGMDASGRKELIRIISGLQDVTMVLVTHNLEDFLGIVDRCIVLSEGRMAADIGRGRLVDRLGDLEAMGVVPPLVLSVQDWLAKAGIRTGETLFDMKQLVGHLKSGG